MWPASRISTGRVGRAVLQGVVDQVVDGPPQARGDAEQQGRGELGVERGLGGVPVGALDGLADDEVQAHVLGVRWGLLAAGEFDEVVDEQRQLLDLLDDVAEQLLALGGVDVGGLLEDLDVGAQARDRRAQLVRGVGDELALGVHGGVERAHRAPEGVEHRVEADREAPDLIGAVGGDASREVLGARDVLGGACQAPDGRDDGARDDPAQQRREGDPAERDQREDQPQAAQHVVDFGERLGELDGQAGAHALGEDAQVDAVDARVAEERAPAACRERARAGADRQRDLRGARAHEDLAGGAHELLVAAHLVRTRGEAPEGVVRGRAREESRGCGHVVQAARDERQAVRAIAQLGVDLPAQLVADEQVGQRRGEQHGDGDRGGREQRDAAAEAHQPRST